MGYQKDFVWGAATASYQIEGAWNEDGRGLTVWDVFSHQPGKIYEGHTGDTACDHYHLFKKDVAIMKEIGIKAYRFSLCWSRIFPQGIGEVNECGVQFYSDLIDELLANGIEPYVTLFHWDYPYALHRKGGWLNDDSVEWFAQYAATVVERFSDRVKYFITFNEPQCFIGGGYQQGDLAPGYKMLNADVFQMCHNVLKAHGAAVKRMRASAKGDIKIGYAPTCSAHYPVTDREEDIRAAREAFFRCPPPNESFMWNCAWWSDPVILGKYPQEGLELYRDYLPEITEEDMLLISQPIDFYAQNIYNGHGFQAGENGRPVAVERPAGSGKTASQWPITPESLRWGPKFLYERYQLPIFITENGMSCHDVVSLDGKVHDPNRIDFLARYLGQMEKAVDEGVDLRGYFLWLLMDNFEWGRGYSERFGIVYVDYNTQERVIKDSGLWYRDWIQQHS